MAVLGIYFQFLTDSDVILVVFQKTDYDTFEDALKILDELTEVTTKRTKIFLVQTFGDMKMADINPQRINELRESGRIIDFVSLDSRSLAEVDSLFSRVMHEISWESERIMIESAYADGILRTVAKLYDAHSTVVPLDKVHDSFKEIMGFDVSNAHMKFLLRNLASQGFVEYYPEILDRLVLNDDNYNRLRTEIPIFVRNHQGIVKTDSILQNFTPADYAAMIDKLFLVYKISIENDGLRLFPAKLKTGPVEIPRRYKALLEKSPQLRRSYRRQSVKTERILEALSDLKLRCIDAAQKGGLFAWEENACIYYSFGDVADSIRGDTLQFQFYVGGTNEKISDRLTIEFSEIIDRFFGPPLETEDNRKKFLSATSTT